MNYSNTSKYWYILVAILLLGNSPFSLKGQVNDSEKLVIDIHNIATSPEGEYLIPVYYEGTETLQSLDLHFKFYAEKLNITEVRRAVNGVTLLSNIEEDNNITISGFLLGITIESGQNIFYLVTPTMPNELTADCFDLSVAYGLVNGESVEVEIGELSTSIGGIDSYFSMYPNPADKMLYVRFKDNASIEGIGYSVFDFTGKLIQQEDRGFVVNTSFQIYTEDYRNGIYLFVFHSIQTGKLLEREKIMIRH